MMNVQEAAEFLSVSRMTIYNWIEKKGLPHIKIGKCIRFDKEDILKWLEQFKVNNVEKEDK